MASSLADKAGGEEAVHAAIHLARQDAQGAIDGAGRGRAALARRDYPAAEAAAREALATRGGTQQANAQLLLGDALSGKRDWVLCESRNFLGRCIRVHEKEKDLKRQKFTSLASSIYEVP